MKELHIDTVYTAMRTYLAFAIMVFSLTAVAKLLSDFPWPRGQEIVPESKFATWDAGSYLALSRDGYVADTPLFADKDYE